MRRYEEAQNLARRLDAERHRAFVGRTRELSAFEDFLRSESARVLVLHGRTGFGKTTLLAEFARRARGLEYPVVEIRGSALSTSERRLREELGVLGLVPGVPGTDPVRQSGSGDPDTVVLIDDADAVEDLLRTRILPQAPASLRVVLATSAPPAHAWAIDPGWRLLVRSLPLGELDRNDSVALLQRLGVDGERQEALWAESYGHPLTMTLLARSGLLGTSPEGGYLPERVESMVDVLVGPLPPRLLEALVICAHAGTATEELLTSLLDANDDPGLWARLRTLGVVHTGPAGVCLSPAMRRLIEQHMLHRAPDRFRDLHTAVHRFAVDRLTRGWQVPGRGLGPVSLLFSGHPNSALSRAWGSPDVARAVVRRGSQEDRAALVAAIRSLPEAAQPPDVADAVTQESARTFVTEIDRQVVAGALCVVVPPGDRGASDPVVAAALDHLDSTGTIRPGDSVHVLRLATDLGGDREECLALYTGVAAAVVGWLVERPAFGLVVSPPTDRWRAILDDLALEPLFAAAGGGPHDIHIVDFRRLAPAQWFGLVTEFKLTGEPEVPPGLMGPALPTYGEFSTAVRECLRNFARPDRLADNALARSSLVTVSEAPPPVAIQQQILAARDWIRTHHRHRIYGQVLDLTYIHPMTSHRAAAQSLHLPLTTYRRYLRRAEDVVAELLWAGGAPKATEGARITGDSSRIPL